MLKTYVSKTVIIQQKSLDLEELHYGHPLNQMQRQPQCPQCQYIPVTCLV